MLPLTLLPLTILLLLPLTQAADTVLGLYIFSRHGDRTSKAWPPTTLTPLGYREIFTSGSRFRATYINGTGPIANIAPNAVKLSQISASAPLDSVLMPSAQGFLQGLYPPVGGSSQQKLANGTVVDPPLDGYQLIPVATAGTGTGSEDQAWLQGSTNCANAAVSSNQYFTSAEYLGLLNSTRDFYQGLLPVINSTFNADQASYKMAYSIFDYINVATIHNATIPSSSLLTPSTLTTLSSLASTHEFNLAYNASSPIRAIAGATLAAQILSAFTSIIASANGSSPTSAPLLTLQLGAYAQFQSFFGLANLTALNGSQWTGIPDYASSMTFELFTSVPPTPFPQPKDLKVRFLFHNGSTEDPTPVAYPLFGQSSLALPWEDFVSGMGAFAVGDQKDWCLKCGNSTGVCAAAAPSPSSSSSSSSSGSSGGKSGSGGGGGVSKPVAGVIGAVVTLAVVLGVEGLVLLVGGLRVGRKGKGGGSGGVDGKVGNGVGNGAGNA